MAGYIKLVLALLLIFVLISTFKLTVFADEARQERITATPLPISLVSPTPFATIAPELTATPVWTATPVGPAVLEAIEEANVRSDASVDAELLGKIRPGQVYPIIGRYYEWYQFQYDPLINNGRGWVFGQLVNVTGNIEAIPDLSAETATTDLLGLSVNGGEDNIVPTETPGDPLTATAQARIISVPGTNLSGVNIPENVDETEISGGEANISLLPTFTYPANIIAIAPTITLQEGIQETTPIPDVLPISVSNGVPMIIPIITLGIGGIIGLIVSSVRR